MNTSFKDESGKEHEHPISSDVDILEDVEESIRKAREFYEKHPEFHGIGQGHPNSSDVDIPEDVKESIRKARKFYKEHSELHSRKQGHPISSDIDIPKENLDALWHQFEEFFKEHPELLPDSKDCDESGPGVVIQQIKNLPPGTIQVL